MRAKRLPPHRLAPAMRGISIGPSAQMVAHHTCGGCNLEARRSDRHRHDLGAARRRRQPARAHRGGREPVTLPSGETRRFLDDGDEVILRAHCPRDGFAPIGFGECRGTVQPAV